jgi:hypothetical protein
MRQTFGGFQCHVADEAIAHHHVGGALENIVAFNVTVEIQVAGPQQFAGLLDNLIAFDFFAADIQQADTGIGFVFQRGNQRGTHQSELQQMLGIAIGIGTQVEHTDLSTFGRQI